MYYTYPVHEYKKANVRGWKELAMSLRTIMHSNAAVIEKLSNKVHFIPERAGCFSAASTRLCNVKSKQQVVG